MTRPSNHLKVWLISLACFSILSCVDDDVSNVDGATQALSTVESLSGDVKWSFTYDNCRLIRVDFIEALPVDLAPLSYVSPIIRTGDLAAVEFVYDDAEPLPATIRLIDDIRGDQLVRDFAVQRQGGAVIALQPRQTLTNGQPGRSGSELDQSVIFAYTADGQIDSIAYAFGYSVSYTYDASGDIEKAIYRDAAKNQETVEFYSYQPGAVNPFSTSPLRFVFSYAAYWSPRMIRVGSFDLRQYDHTFDERRVSSTTDLTYADSTAVMRYTYEPLTCN